MLIAGANDPQIESQAFFRFSLLQLCVRGGPPQRAKLHVGFEESRRGD